MSDLASQPAPAVALLPIYCPFGSAINPRAAAIEQRCIDWIDRHELFGSDASRRRLIDTRAAEIYSRALPTADEERVADVAKWLYWGFATDDLFYDNGPTSVSARDFLALGAPLVRICEEPRARFAWEPPYTEALRDLVVAVRRHATAGQAIAWAQTARAWFFGMAWDVANAERGAPPSLNDYLMMRMHTGGLASWVTTLGIANGVELRPEQSDAGPVRALTEAWSTLCLLLNDLMSYAKEVRNGDSSSNVISVVAHERSCTPQEALPKVYVICDRLANLVLELREQILATADEPMRTYVTDLGHTWRGILDWGFSSPRYMVSDGPEAVALQKPPGWADAPTDSTLSALPYPSISWWWEEVHSSRLVRSA